MFQALRAPSPHTQAIAMDADFLEFFLTTGQVGLEEKSSWTWESSELQFSAFQQSDISYSHVDKDLNTIQDPFYDIFGLDISTIHEDILMQGPEGNRVPQNFPGIPSALPDYFQYRSIDSDHAGTFDGFVGCQEVAAYPEDVAAVSSGVFDISHSDEAFLDQLRYFLEADGNFPPVLSVESSSDSMDSRPPSGVPSMDSLESQMTPIFYSYPTPTETVQEVVQSPLATLTQVMPKRQISAPDTSVRRPYRRKYTTKPASPTSSVASTNSSIKKCTKVTPTKRKQNRKAAGDYRKRKRLIEEVKMQQHEDLLKVRDGLKEQRTALEQELKFAIKMAEAKMKRLAAL